MDTSQSDLQRFFHPYIVKFVPGWKSIKPEQLVVLNTVGITNKTYIIKQEAGLQPEAIIFRHFGESCEGNFLDRKIELQVVEHIGNIGLGPTFYGAEDRVSLPSSHLLDQN